MIFTGCSHCVSPHGIPERLASAPMDDLDVSDLNRYAFKAMTTWGTERHFKHFLPRLFELAFDNYLSFEFPEVLFGKLSLANWSTWIPAEQDAVQSYLFAFWKHQLHLSGDFLRDERIGPVLGGLAEACDSLNSYLDIWGETATESSALHLAQFISNSAEQIMTTCRVRLWGERISQFAEIVKWLQTVGAEQLLLRFRDVVVTTFPLVLDELSGIRAAMLSEGEAAN